jgi:hypothetical protein
MAVRILRRCRDCRGVRIVGLIASAIVARQRIGTPVEVAQRSAVIVERIDIVWPYGQCPFVTVRRIAGRFNSRKHCRDC